MSNHVEQILDQARLLAKAGKNEDARDVLLELLKNDPNNTAALLMLSGSYFYDEKYQEAEMVFERLILMEPGVGKFSIGLFNTLWKQERHEEALEEIRRFLNAADKVTEKETVDQYLAIVAQLSNDN